MNAADFIAAEVHRVHELMDLMDVPRTAGDALLSMAQRVELYVQSRRETVRLIGTLRLRR